MSLDLLDSGILKYTCEMYGCVCLTKLSAPSTLHDTELSVAACQLLLSYRDTHSPTTIDLKLSKTDSVGRGQGW